MARLRLQKPTSKVKMTCICKLMHVDYAVFVRGLERGYGKKKILHDINMSVGRGTIYGLLGPSGCGKTTLLKVWLYCVALHAYVQVLLGRLVPENGYCYHFDVLC